MRAAPLLSVQGLVAKRASQTVVCGVDLDIEPGDRIYVCGQNGCGKSTFLEALLGLIPSSATHCEWLSRPGRPLEHKAFRAGLVSYLPQQRNLFTSLTLRANILLGSTLGRSERAERLTALLDYVFEIAPALDKLPRNCSTGERQLAAVLRTLMHKPALLNLDEPTASVSTATIPRLYDAVDHFFPSGSALIYTDQHRLVAEHFATRRFEMVSGVLVPMDGDQEAATTSTSFSAERSSR